VRVGNVSGIGHYPWFFDYRLGVRSLASADRAPLVSTAAAFVSGGDWYRSTVLRHAGEVCDAARGSRRQRPEGNHGEAARLQLDDLDWRAGRIILRGKASREDGMPCPPMSGRR
jgi:hypothetical protein